jgi:hypothetical protein
MPMPKLKRLRYWPAAAMLLLLGCLSDFVNPVNQDGALIEFQPRDTALYTGSSYLAQAKMRNGYGDLYPSEHIEYAALDSMVSVSRRGRVTGGALGRARVIATRADLADTGWVSVVPVGTLALSLVSEHSFVDVVNLDGSEFHRIAPSGLFGRGAPAWLPSGDGLIYEEAGSGGAGLSILSRTDLAGNRAVLLPPGPGSASDQKYPRVSRDGVWVYFRLASDPWSGSEIWRSHLDGTGLERVTDTAAVGAQDSYPDPSPDGTRLLFASNRFALTEFEIVVRDLASGGEQALGVEGLLPRWSPAGDRIAYWAGDQFLGQGSIFVMRSDGTEPRMVTPVSRVYLPQGLDWSADAEWLVARAASNFELIHVATGMVLPLGYTGANGWASWRR